MSKRKNKELQWEILQKKQKELQDQMDEFRRINKMSMESFENEMDEITWIRILIHRMN